MDLFDATQRTLSAAIHATAARQSVIAANIANVNTPGYRRQDVEFDSALQDAMRSADPDALERFQPTVTTDSSQPVRADGNSVDIDSENSALAANELQNQALLRVAASRIAIMQSAIGAAR